MGERASLAEEIGARRGGSPQVTEEMCVGCSEHPGKGYSKWAVTRGHEADGTDTTQGGLSSVLWLRGTEDH